MSSKILPGAQSLLTGLCQGLRHRHIDAVAPAAAFAQIRQVSSSPANSRNTFSFSIGYFGLRGIDSRDPDDVLVGDLINAYPLLFEVNDLNRATVGGEYLFAPARQVEIGVGLGFSQRTITTEYATIAHSNQDPIFQDIKLRMMPELSPFFHNAAREPMFMWGW